MDKNRHMSATTTTAGASHRLRGARRIQNCMIVWLDSNIDEVENKKCINAISKLRQVVNNVNTFTDVNECINFVSNTREEKIFMISSGIFGKIAVPIVHPMPQVNTIYIFCGSKPRYEQWARNWSKVKCVFTEITPICEALKTAVRQCDQNMVSISFVASNEGVTKQSVNELNQSFMYTQIMKEILLTIDFEQQHIDKFIQYCEEQLVGNNKELATVDKLKQEYRKHMPIWWYTLPGFLYSMLNRALRLMEVDLIIMLGFFIRDLHQDIAALHAEQYGGHNRSASFTVYRGQGLSQADFDQLMRSKGGLLSFNNFLSTSMTRQVSLDFVQGALQTTDLVGILFVMKIDPSIKSTLYANVSEVSYFQTEDEILFSMHSIFRIAEIKSWSGDNRLWEVDLTLTADNDPQLRVLTESILEDLQESKGWNQLGQLLINIGHYDKAQELYEILLSQTHTNTEQGSFHYYLGCVKYRQGKYDDAHVFHQKALEIYADCLPQHHSNFGKCFNDIGTIYEATGEYSKALSSFEKALEIFEKVLPPNYPLLATAYNNIGAVYKKMGEYFKALSSHEKALEIKQKYLPPNHPNLAISYDNIGGVYMNMDEHSKALSSHEKALEILQKVLPPNHPDLAASYNNIGAVFYTKGEYPKALSYYERALEIQQKALPSTHLSLATFYNNIGAVYEKMDNYSKALSCLECALDIKQRVLPTNHADVQDIKEWIEDIKEKL